MKLKKLSALLLAVVMVFVLAACGSDDSDDAATDDAEQEEDVDEEDGEEEDDSEDPEFVTIVTLNEEQEEVEIEVPYNPERVAVMDLAILDMLDNFGVGDSVVGVSKGSSIDYLQDYVNNDDIINLGTIKEADMEAVMECEPEIIFIGGRLSSQYEALSEIAPVVYLATDTEKGVVQSTRDNALNVASIFGEEDVVEDLLAEYDERIDALSEVAQDSTAAIGMVSSGGFNVLGNDGRCSIIGVEIGFDNIGLEAAAESSSERGGGGGGDRSESSEDGESSERGESSEDSSDESSDSATATHGNEASFEVLVSLDPDYIFVMDRDAAINTDGAQLAEEVFDNELVHMTSAYENDQIVYLEHSNVWYTAEGGITALGIMLEDLESALLK